MDRRSFLTLLPLMPMVGKLMVTMPKKYLGVADLAAATKHMGPRLAELLFRPDPMLSYLQFQYRKETDPAKLLEETWLYAPEDAPGAPE